MIDFIFKYWIEVGFGLIVTIIGYGIKEIRGWKTSQDAIKDGVLSILHDNLYRGCQNFIGLGYISIDELKNLEYLYRSYKALGGNGTGKIIWEKVCELPIKESED